MEWIYFSPHLDDVALSCGGLVWEQRRAGQRVSIWTLCAGDPPAEALSPFAQSLHARWGSGADAVALRRQEDRAACAALEADYRHLNVPDCIYRREEVSRQALYASESDIFGELKAEEEPLVDRLSAMLQEELPEAAALVCPLTVGGHVDHRLTRAVVEKAQHAGWELWYYADYPYIQNEVQALAHLAPSLAWNMHVYALSEAGMQAWLRAVAAYTSQISTFWQDIDTMRAELSAYAHQAGGARLWQRKNL
jgi:LmbE family N-acetylglucosaminyl deacetylase